LRQRPQLDLITQYFEVNFDNLAEELAACLPPESPTTLRQHEAARHLRRVIRGLMAERTAGGNAESAIALVDRMDELADLERDLLSERMQAVVERAGHNLRPRESPAADASVLRLVRQDTPPAASGQRGARPRPEKAAFGAAGVRSLQELATKSLELLNADICQVYLDEGVTLSLQAESPENSSSSGPDHLSPVKGFVSLVRRSGRAITLDDLELLEGAERTWVDRGAASLAAVPVGAPGDPGSGLLVAARVTRRPFSRSDTIEMARLADEVTLAMASTDLLARAEELAVLKERMKLAREIHDGLASDLSAVVQMFKYHEHRRQVDPTDADQILLSMRELVEGALRSARDILSALRPRQQVSRRLAESIQHQVEAFSKTYDVSGVTKILGDDSQLVSEEREAIFQVVRESLTNIRKHSMCSTVLVTLDMRNRPFVVTVEDDGVGIDPGATDEKNGSFGILGMRERAQLLGGTLDIGNGPMGGARLEFQGPAVPIGA